MNTASPPYAPTPLDQIVVPIGPPPPLPPNLPCLQLIEGSREDYIKIGVPLYEASIKGDWIAAKAILDLKPELIRFAITKNFETPLHVAASAGSTKCAEVFVENLVNMMETKDLELQNSSYNTALSLAATVGNVKATIIMVKKNIALLEIPGSEGMMPLYVAALFGKADVVRYLYDNSKKMSSHFWTNEKRGWVLQKCVEADVFDVAVKILNDYTQLTSDKRLLRDVLLVLAEKSRAFEEKKPTYHLRTIKSTFHVKVDRLAESESDSMKLLRIIWEKVAIMPNNEIDQIMQGPPLEIGEGQYKKNTYPSRILFVAAKRGNLIFVVHLIQFYPDLIWAVDDRGLSIFHLAIKHRQASIYNLLYEIGSMKEFITTIEDESGNNMLHLLANSTKPKRYKNLAGVALQMQHELLWFQEVAEMMPPAYRQRRNKDGQTPHDIFTKKHEQLVADGEKWMKDTAPQCMVVATLIATMVFTAAFTPPGGYDQNTGIPMFRQKAALIVFVIVDALSLIFSATSILLFLSMFTSRYAEDDFLESLPKKLMLGLATLFVSIMTMMIAFSASFFVVYDKNWNWLSAMVTSFATVLVFVYSMTQFPFLGDIFYSTYKSRSLFQPKKRMLYC